MHSLTQSLHAFAALFKGTTHRVGPAPAAPVAAVGAAEPRAGTRLAERLASLDAFRGITIAAMILVNNPGTWRHGYRALRHADWNGWTSADLIFPFFLFIVGVAITFSIAAGRPHRASAATLAVKVIRRTLILFSLGLLLNAFPFFHWSHLRIPGVLQRIALCYGFASAVVLTMSMRGQAITTVLLLLAYWTLLTSTPGYAGGGLERGDNLAAYIDHTLLHGHLLRHRWDPEGILSTLPAVATTLSGVLAGHWLRSSKSPLERVVGLFVMGNACLALGLVMDFWFPINKNLWTSSYVLFTSGMALNGFGMCYWLIDIKGYRRWAKPFVIYGVNPITAYVLSSLVDKATISWLVTRPDGDEILLKTYLFERFFLPLASRSTASFLYAVIYVLLWLGVMAILYRKRIFIKI